MQDMDGPCGTEQEQARLLVASRLIAKHCKHSCQGQAQLLCPAPEIPAHADIADILLPLSTAAEVPTPPSAAETFVSLWVILSP